MSKVQWSNTIEIEAQGASVVIREADRQIQIFYDELPALIDALKRANSDWQMRQLERGE